MDQTVQEAMSVWTQCKREWVKLTTAAVRTARAEQQVVACSVVQNTAYAGPKSHDMPGWTYSEHLVCSLGGLC